MNKNWLSLLTICGLTIALIFFWDAAPNALLGKNEDAQEKSLSRAQYPTNIVTNHNSQHFNDNGQLNHVFLADELRHYQIHPKRQTAKDFTDVTKPHVTLHREDAPPWTITSDTGRSNKNSSVITLTGNVVVTQVDAQGNTSELTTSRLILKPDDQYAETNKPVMILAPDSTTSAVGMKAYLKNDNIQLLSRVRGLYENP